MLQVYTLTICKGIHLIIIKLSEHRVFINNLNHYIMRREKAFCKKIGKGVIEERIYSFSESDSKTLFEMYETILCNRNFGSADLCLNIVLWVIDARYSFHGRNSEDLQKFSLFEVERTALVESLKRHLLRNKVVREEYKEDLFYKALLLWTDEGLIHETRIKSKKNKYTTIIKLKFNLTVKGFIDLDKFLLYSHKPYNKIIINGVPYLHSGTLNSLQPMFIYSKKNRNITWGSIGGVEMLSQTPISVNRTVLKKALNIIHAEIVRTFKKFANEGYLGEISSMDEMSRPEQWIYLNSNIGAALELAREEGENVKARIREIKFQQVNTTHLFTQTNKKLTQTTLNSLGGFKPSAGLFDDLNWLSRITKDYQRINSLVLQYFIAEWTLKQKRKFYLPHRCDFRGRIYSNSLLSPIYNKILRPLYQFGEGGVSLESQTKIKKTIYYSKIKNIFQIKNFTDYCRIMIELEVGKLFVKDLVSIEKPYVDICDIRDYGSKMMQLKLDDLILDLDEKIYFIVLKHYHTAVLCETPQYVPVLLDSTASGQQVLTKICKVSSPAILKTLNLHQNRVWYDTYYYILNQFVIEHSLDEDFLKVKPLFFRKSVKKIIMTSFYNVTLHTSFNYFFSAIEGYPLSIEERELAIQYIKKFYSFLTTTFLKDRYDLDSLKALKFSNKYRFDNKYYEYEKQEKEIRIIKDKRLLRAVYNGLIKNTLLLNAISIGGEGEELSINQIQFIVNKKKTEVGNAPNIVHNQDSEIVVAMIKDFNYNIYTIHDMFITTLYNKAMLYDKMNSYYNLNKKNYSTTILI